MDVRLFARIVAVGGAVICFTGVVLDIPIFMILGGALMLLGIFADRVGGGRKR